MGNTVDLSHFKSICLHAMAHSSDVRSKRQFSCNLKWEKFILKFTTPTLWNDFSDNTHSNDEQACWLSNRFDSSHTTRTHQYQWNACERACVCVCCDATWCDREYEPCVRVWMRMCSAWYFCGENGCRAIVNHVLECQHGRCGEFLNVWCLVYILCGLLKKKEIWIYCQSLVYWKIVNGPGHAEKIMDFQKKVQKRREEIVLQHTIEFARILMFLSCAHSAHSPKLECSLGWFDFDLHFLASILFVMEHSIQRFCCKLHF